MNVTVIIPAAGAGKRFASDDPLGGAATSKVELDLAGKPVFLRSIELFLKRPGQVGRILLAVNPDAMDEFKFKWADKLAFHDISLVPGGKKERWETVANALKQVGDDTTHVAVHDAARPLASRKLVDRVLEAANAYAAVVPGLPVANTLKRVEAEVVDGAGEDPLDAILGGAGRIDVKARRVVETVSRENIVEIQTPQVFELGLLRRAYAQIEEGKIDASKITDDAGLVEALGEPVHVVEGEVTNLKITRPEDAEFAAAVMERRDKKGAKELAKKRLFGDEDD